MPKHTSDESSTSLATLLDPVLILDVSNELPQVSFSLRVRNELNGVAVSSILGQGKSEESTGRVSFH